MILLLSAISSLHAADPASGTISVSGPAVTWNGQTVAGAETTEANCMEGLSCDTFKLTLSGSPADWNGRVVNVGIKWMSGTEASDYDMYIHKGAPNGPIVATSVQTPSRSENAAIEPDVHGTGDYYIHVAAYIAAGAADPYNGTATSADPLPRLDPAPQATNVVAPRFQIHAPTNEQLAAGFGRDAAEPSIGVNWNTGSVFYQAMLQTLRVRFDDSCVSSPRATWEDKSPVTSSVITFDPILYTDRDTGRTFASQLLFPTTDSATSYTTTDGESWIPSQGAGISSGVDHQTLGGGPFHAPLTGGVGLYPNAVYYCAQNIADANCALSLDGGQTFGPAIPLYTVDQCAGLHGHVKVAPDGTVYVPNPACGGELLTKTSQAVLVSEDNGLTWDIRTVPDADASGSDPSVAVGANGRLYFGFSDGDGAAGVSGIG